MILLFTDFGPAGPYLGQMEAVLRLNAPGVDVIHLVSDAPAPLPAGYLLAALCRQFPEGSVFLSVVDPGVGGDRQALVLEADGRWFVGPGNGLLNTVAAQAESRRWLRIDWRPARLSASFHGRDLFAPVAARIAKRDFGWEHQAIDGPDVTAWPADRASIVYFDHYGNALTGLRYRSEFAERVLRVNDRQVPHADVFCAVEAGAAFWYRNSLDLVEVAVNRGRADQALDLAIGDSVVFEP
ncbi:SAM-dependent chlorinase/fluorinase [Methylococcus sp. ANG]|uniref:SAM hydrolase/SAM-dependent halogenase family protein n=1 Tax=Methylococcus sp. ANG TaxID=3231903 RepID=UPI003457CCB2